MTDDSGAVALVPLGGDLTLDRRSVLGAGAAVGLGLALAGSGALVGPSYGAPRVDRVLARGLEVPWGLAFLPRGDALVAERTTGRIYRVRRTGGKRLVGRVPTDAQGEGGLLGLAVHPGFARGRNWVYAYVTTATDNRIIRMRFANNRLGPRRLVLAGIPKGFVHNGGRLRFGPGGMLFASTGDAQDTSLAQDRRSLAGKILRLTPTGAVPRGNPFGNHVWSLGHRNVQGLVVDDKGRMWASEFGQNRLDEMNRIVKGGNYGWPGVEGSDGPGGFRDPFVTWTPDECSPSGITTAKGWAYVAALRGQSLWAVKLNGARAGRRVRLLEGRFGRIRTVERAPDGSLWIATSNRDGRGRPTADDDRVIRLVL